MKKSFCLEIEPRGMETEDSFLDMNALVLHPAPVEDLMQYNKLLSQCVENEFWNLDFRVSASLCRMEAQTHLFDSIYKYKLVLSRIRKGVKLRMENLDLRLLCALIEFLKKAGLSFHHDAVWPLLVYKVQLSRPFFYLKCLLHTVYLAWVSYNSRRILGSWSPKGKHLFITYYDERCRKSDGSYQDAYFDPLHRHMQEEGIAYSVLSIFVGRKGFRSSWERLHQMKLMQQKVAVHAVEALVSARDLLSILWKSLRHKPQLRESVSYQGCDIRDLVNLCMKEDLGLRNNSFFTFTMLNVAGKILEHKQIQHILYPYENQPWERLLNFLKFERMLDVQTLAYQHTSFSLKLLNHFPTDADRASRILPDKILTVGTVLKDFLYKHSGLRKEQVLTACALRHQYLHSALAKRVPQMRKRIAFAFSSDFHTYPEIVRSLVHFFGNSDYEVHFKMHPLFKGQGLSLGTLPANFHVEEQKSWKELFEQVDFLLYHDNSLGIEAFAYGVPSCEYAITGDVYDSSRVFAYEGLHAGVRSLEDLEIFMMRIRKLYEDAGKFVEEQKKMQDYVEAYFVPPSRERLQIFL